jgi:hypothetical protein
VHLKKLITKVDPKGANNVLTCMARSNIGDSKDCVFMVAEDGVTTWSNALLDEDM